MTSHANDEHKGGGFGGSLWLLVFSHNPCWDLNGICLLGYEKGCYLRVEALQWATPATLPWPHESTFASGLRGLSSFSICLLEPMAEEQCHGPVALFGFLIHKLLELAERYTLFEKQLLAY